MHDEQADVLVVGAGPVGLYTGLLLAKSGFQVRVIDREDRTTSRSYACALHPRSLKLLESAGVLPDILDQGRKISHFAFYEGATRRAEVDLGKLGGDFPFLVIVPQSILERALERKLTQAGGAVLWNHRFDDLQETGDEVTVTVEKLGGTGTGYIVPHWETVVEKSFDLRARFLVGTDGHKSLVRRRLGLEFQRHSGPEFFAAYEFESDSPGPDEVRVVLDASTTNVLWPLAANRRRWTFQLAKGDPEFPGKERRAARLGEKVEDERIRKYVEQVAAHRAPWFKEPVCEITWCTDVAFEHGAAVEFGHGRCWLAGDAAHQTGPVGAQSMNVGLSEATSLVQRIEAVMRGKGSPAVLASYNQERQKEWNELLGKTAELCPKGDTPEWVRQRAPRILSCIPGSGDDLSRLAAQLQLEFRQSPVAVSC